MITGLTKKSHHGMINIALMSLMILNTGAIAANFKDHHASEEDESGMEKQIGGQAVTGPNRVLGQPIWDFGHGLGAAGFTFLGGFDAAKDNPTVLTTESDEETVLATILDENYLGFLGISSEDIDPKLVNVPLREVAVIANPAGNRTALPPTAEALPGKPSRSAPNQPITLKQWLEGEGGVAVKCEKDGSSTVKFKFKNLIANGIYTVWGVYAIEGNSEEPTDLGLYPLGGVPNTFVANSQGRAHMLRELNFCPLDETLPGSTDGSTTTLLSFDVVYHSDGSVYGASSDLGLAGFPGGTVSHTHMQFPVHAEPIKP